MGEDVPMNDCEYCRNMEEPFLNVEYIDHMGYHLKHCTGYGYCPHNLTKEGIKVEDEYPLHKDIRCDDVGCYCDYYSGMDLGNGRGSIRSRYDYTQDTTKPKYRRDY